MAHETPRDAVVPDHFLPSPPPHPPQAPFSPITHCSRHAGLPTILPTYQALFGLQHWLTSPPGRFFPKRATSLNSPPPSGLCANSPSQLEHPRISLLKNSSASPFLPIPSSLLFSPHSPYLLLKITEFMYLLCQHPLLPATSSASIPVSSSLCICLEIIHTEIG